MTEPIRVAVIGAGGIAQVAHLPVLRKIAGVEVAAICDNDLGKAQALAARFGFTETRLGILPSVISPFVIAKIGESHARALFPGGKRFDATRAARIGLIHEVVEGEARLRPQEAEAKVQEAAAAEELRALEADLETARSERESVARDVPRDILGQYGRLLKVRGGLAVALVGSNGICSGCRVTLTPQRFNEVRQSSQIFVCENCGRFLYYQP